MAERFVVQRLLLSLVILTMGLALAGQTSATAQEQGNTIEIDGAKPAEYWLAAGNTGMLAPDAPKGLAEIAPDNMGWFDYDFKIDRQGWYRLVVEATPNASRTEFLFDAVSPAAGTRLTGNTALGNQRFLVGWIWLTPGTHRLRAQHLHWSGMPRIPHMRLEAAPPAQSLAFRVVPPETTTFAIGKCTPLTLETGGNETAFAIEAVFSLKGRVLAKRQIEIAPSPVLTRHAFDLPCDSAGDVAVDLRGTDLNVRSHVDYAVFDTSPVEPSFQRGRVAIDIDAANRQPDFQAGESSVISGPAGTYRSSGTRGSTPFSRRLAALGLTGAPDWFAYRVEGLLPNQPYILEVEYPDDAPRVLVAAFRDSKGQGYPISIGAETGAIWPLSDQMAKTSAVIWPSSSDGRVIVFNVHDGMRAAVGHIRIYEATSQQTKQTAVPAAGRDVTFWHEEGDNFRDLVGEGNEPGAVFTPVDRYLALARSSGATIVSPTVAVYNFALYPSRFHRAFEDPDRDMTAAFMLGAERYGLKIVPQLYPRADELLWPPRTQLDLEKRLLLSADGQHHLLRPDGDFLRPPFYNPLNDDVKNWYVDMIGELADRYKNYPAFAGIDLRVSDWQNSALNNLVSLDWGYDAETVARFFRESKLTPWAGLDLSTDTPKSARQRHDYLLARLRATWIAWRCEKIRDLYRDIVLRLRAARPDLRLSVSIFGQRTWSPESMREFGIDLSLLQAIDGLTVIDERFGHGARDADLASRCNQQTDILSARNFDPFALPHSRPQVIFPMEYVEITGNVAPAKAIGLPVPPKEPWVSSATEPPGRLALARFATVLGLTDAFMLGDGGNGYVFGNEPLREFMAEFRTLPRQPFERVNGLPEAIVVRQHDGTFYVVNMLGVPVSARLQLDAPGSPVHTTFSEITTAGDGSLTLDLLAYQIVVLRTEAGRRVLSAEVSSSGQAGRPSPKAATGLLNGWWGQVMNDRFGACGRNVSR